jgi:hypothetical protein
MDDHIGGVKAQKRSSGGNVWHWSQIRFTLMISRSGSENSEPDPHPCLKNVDDLLDPVDDPVCLVPPVDGGLHPVLQQRVQHPVLLHRIRVHALKYSGFNV